ncbi:uncharacterized protein [Temnothorax longispinosus]|uniref:uncharacterized protein isoform X4 n=1 Tax=Temnothorax longispinosus TaxID=300112 RepID=UPI003A9947BB
MIPKRRHSKLWNYFEELKSKLVKCTTCKKEIKIPHPTSRTTILRAHLKKHGIFLDNDTLPADLRQYYSELPRHKAKCNDCDKTMSMLTNVGNLRVHLRRHCTKVESRDEPSTSSSTSYDIDPNAEHRNQETVDLTLQSCKQLKKETRARVRSSTSILTGYNTNSTAECYSQETVDLDPQTCKQSRKETRACDGTAPKGKRRKLWDYFKGLKPSLVKCTMCKKKIKTPNPPTRRTKIMRVHLLKRHGIFLKDDTFKLPDDLRQYYLELPGYKAKCIDCCKTLSFLTNIAPLRQHLERHSTRIQSQDDPSTSTSTCVMDSSVERQSQHTSGLPVQAFKETTEKTGALNESSSSISTGYNTNHTAECQSQETVDLALQTCEQSRKETRARDGPSISSLTGHDTNPSTECQSQESPGLPILLSEQIRIALDTIERPRTSITMGFDTRPTVECQSQESPGLSVQSFKETAENAGILEKSSTSSLADYRMDPPAERQNQDTSSLPIQLFKGALNESSTSISTGYNTNSTTECHSQETVDLDPQTCKQSRKETRACDGTVTMTWGRKRSKFWNYFEELNNPSLVKCTICKEEIKIHHSNSVQIFREHLLIKHGISVNNDTYILPDVLKQYYSELPEYKAKCKDCGKTFTFLTSMVYLREHLIRHSTKIQSRDETAPKGKRRKLWDYFKGLKPSLVKCTICKKEIKTPNPTMRTKIIRIHLLKRHGISLNDDTFKLPDDLRQYYSELPGYKAKCKDCCKTLSFLTNTAPLRQHLERHSTRIQSRDESSTSISTGYNTNPTSKCQSQKTVDLDPQTYEQSRKETRACDGPSTSTLVDYIMDNSAERQSQDTSSLPVQSFKETTRKTGVLNEPSTSSSTGTDMDPNAERQTQETVDLALQSCEQSKKETRTCDRPSTSSSTGYIMDPSTEKNVILQHQNRQNRFPVITSVLSGRFISKDALAKLGRLKTIHSAPTTEKNHLRQSQKQEPPGLPVQSFKEAIEKTSALDEPSTSAVVDYITDNSAKRQSQYTSDLPVQPFKETTETTGTLNEPRPSSSTSYDIDPNAEHQNQETVDLALQSCEQLKKETRARVRSSTSISTGYNTNSTAECHSQETVDLDPQTCEQSRKETRACDGTVIMAPKRKRNKLWNYFEELKPSLVKCAICKIEIHMPHPSNSTGIMIKHLNRHEIFLNNDTFTLSDDLRQYYSELPRYKAKCNDCSKTISFLTNNARLRKHLRRHSTKILSLDEPSTSTLVDYIMDNSAERQSQNTSLPVRPFKETTETTGTLNEPSTSSSANYNIDPDAERQSQERVDLVLQSCEQLKKETRTCLKSSTSISTGYNTNSTAECHSQETVDLDPQTCKQSRKETRACDGTVTMTWGRKRSKFWNYFEELNNPSLVKCTICKEEIKIHHSNSVQIFREHLLIKHGISVDNDTYILPDVLKQYYSELPEYKAKCKDCGKTFTFFTSMVYLREHLIRHSTKIQSRDEPSTSTLVDYIMDNSAERQSQDTSSLPVQSFKETTEKTGALNEPSTLSSTGTDMDPNAERQSQETIDLALQSCEQSRKETRTCDGPSTSSSTGYIMDPSTEKNISLRQSQEQEPPGLPVQSFREAIEKTGALDEPSTSSTAHYNIDPNAERQSQEIDDLVLQSCKQSRNETRAPDGLSISSSTGYDTNPSAECQYLELPDWPVQSFEQVTDGSSALYSYWFYYTIPNNSSSPCYITDPNAVGQSQETVDLTLQSCEQSKKEITTLDGPSTSITTSFDTNPTAELQSQESPVQCFEQTRKEISALDNTSSSMDYIMGPSAEHQNGEPLDLPVQSFKENAGILDEPSTSSSADYIMDPSAEHQSGEPSGLLVQSFEQMTEGTSALHSNWFYYTIPSTSSSTCYVMAPSAEHQSGEQPGLPVQSFEQMTEETNALYSYWFHHTM